MPNLEEIFRTAIPWLLVASGAIAFIAWLVSIRYFVQRKRASLFILRRRDRHRFQSAVSVAMIASVFVLVTFITWWILPNESTPAAPVAVMTPAIETTPPPLVTPGAEPRAWSLTETPTPEPTHDPNATTPFIPTFTPTLTPSVTPTPSATPTETPTPEPTVPIMEAIYTPVVPYATASIESEIGAITISGGVELNGEPIVPGTEFLSGTDILFASFDYQQMPNGVLWRHIWLRDGYLVGGETRLWEWGSRGRTYVHMQPRGGFTPGDYVVQILVDEVMVQFTQFTITGP